MAAAAVVVSSAQPTAAGVVDAADLGGNFAGDDRDEVFSYVAGSTPDVLVSFSNGGVPGGELTWEVFEFTVNGRYDPVVGNFDGDAYDEILWYGTGNDSVWNFTSFTTVQSRPYTVSGTYEPVAGDFTGDGVDDIIWYGAGAARDFIWEYNASGSYTSIPYVISGTYVPIAGSFATNQTDDVLWYAAGTKPDYLWDFHVGSTSYTSSSPYPVNGGYFPFVLDIFNEGWQGEDIFWYKPGTASDYLWDFFLGERFVSPDPINGTYVPVAGDFVGDTHDDIIWLRADGFSMWEHSPGTEPGTVDRWIYDTATLASASSPADATTAAAVVANDGPVVARSGGTVESGDG